MVQNPWLAVTWTNLAQPGVTSHGGFGGGEVSPGDARPGGAFPNVRHDGGSWVVAGGGGSKD